MLIKIQNLSLKNFFPSCCRIDYEAGLQALGPLLSDALSDKGDKSAGTSTHCYFHYWFYNGQGYLKGNGTLTWKAILFLPTFSKGNQLKEKISPSKFFPLKAAYSCLEPCHPGRQTGRHRSCLPLRKWQKDMAVCSFTSKHNLFQDSWCLIKVNSCYLRFKIHTKLLIPQSKFSGPRKFTLRYQ